MAKIEGTYTLDSSENFDEFMKQLGVGMVTRKVGSSVTPTVHVTVDDKGVYTIKQTSTFKNTSISFELGKEFEEDSADGRKCTSTITMDGTNKMMHVQTGGKKTVTYKREFTPTHMNMVCEVDGVVTKRNYKRH